MCVCVFTHPPCCSLSGLVFVSLTSGACVFVCVRVRVCVRACTARPVTAEEENCICGGTAWMQRGVEILREA